MVNIINDNTRYPSQMFQDYRYTTVHAKIAYPLSEDRSRIWLKGDATFNRAVLMDAQTTKPLTDTVSLSVPYYTELVSVPANDHKILIRFLDKDNNASDQLINQFTSSEFSTENNNYSILLYGCFQPFKVKGGLDNKQAEVFHSKANLNYYTRQFFRDVALGKSLVYQPLKRNDKKPINYFLGKPDTLPMLMPVKLIIGTGDQIYTDAGYKYEGPESKKKKGKFTPEEIYKNHPLSAWAYGCCDPKPVVSEDYFSTHLDLTYHAFNSFTSLDTVFKTFPTINAWDDHEIRDGWGSHGDEYIDETINPDLKPYFDEAKAAYLAHQFNLGPNPIKPVDGGTPHLTQNTSAFDFEVFVLDLRSHRNVYDTVVLGGDQIQEFKIWSQHLKDSSHAIIVSSIPLFYGNTTWSEKQALKATKCELKDDLRDAWSYNRKSQNIILQILIELRSRGIKPIVVSGDVHVGALSEIWYKPIGSKKDENRVLCYEIITSGLSHESLGEGQSGAITYLRDKMEAQRRHDITLRTDELGMDFYPVVRKSRPVLNFGAIEKRDSDIYLNLFLMETEKGQNIFTENSMLLNWNKTYTESEALNYVGFKQVLWNLTHWFGPVYVPPTVEEKKRISFEPRQID